MCDACELLVYEAARARLVSQVIKPALDRGAVVLSDRFFDSTRAYQGAGRGLDEAFINAANAFACQGVMPDRTILLMPPSIEDGLVRATKHTGADRLEQAGAAFHARVREAFLSFAEEDPQRMRLVYSATKKSETAQAVFGNLTDLFPEFSDLLATPEHFASLDVKRIHQDKATFVGVSAQYVAEGSACACGRGSPLLKMPGHRRRGRSRAKTCRKAQACNGGCLRGHRGPAACARILARKHEKRPREPGILVHRPCRLQ